MEEIYVSVEEPGNEYSSNKDFTSLKAWQKCREVKLFFYQKVLPKLPNKEKYNLDIQIRKSSVSTTANISEGYGRYHFQEGIQFYRISRGSLYELKDHLISCYDFKYVGKHVLEEGMELIEEAKKLVNGFINYQKKQKKSFKQ